MGVVGGLAKKARSSRRALFGGPRLPMETERRVEGKILAQHTRVATRRGGILQQDK